MSFFRRLQEAAHDIEEEVQQTQIRSYSKPKAQKVEKQRTFDTVANPNVTGVNSVVSGYFLSQVGAGDHLAKLNFSALPGEKKRLLSITGASTFLVNYAQDEYPSLITVKIDQVGGMNDKTGNLSHVVAVLAPDGPAIPVYNAGGVIGFNVSYKLIDQAAVVDISNLPQITIKVSVGTAQLPAVYPLAQPITMNINITRVVF